MIIMYKGYVIKVKDLKPHSNADRLQVLTVFGTDTCVSLDVKVGDLGIYFPADGQLSIEFCEANHLCRRKQDGTPDTGYMDPDKRNVTAIKLRGEKSDGIYLPIECLAFTGAKLEDFKPGDTVDVVNKIEICKKYIPRSNKTNRSNEGGNRTRKHKVDIAPLFKEHADTEQLAYNLSAFKPGDEIEITLKMHGTSQRTAHVPTLKGYKRTLWDRFAAARVLQCMSTVMLPEPADACQSLEKKVTMVLMNSVNNMQLSSKVNQLKEKLCTTKQQDIPRMEAPLCRPPQTLKQKIKNLSRNMVIQLISLTVVHLLVLKKFMDQMKQVLLPQRKKYHSLISMYIE